MLFLSCSIYLKTCGVFEDFFFQYAPRDDLYTAFVTTKPLCLYRLGSLPFRANLKPVYIYRPYSHPLTLLPSLTSLLP